MDPEASKLNMDGESMALIDVSMEDDDLLSSPDAQVATFDFVGSPSKTGRKSRSSSSPEDKHNDMSSSAAEGDHPPLCEEDDQPKKKRRGGQYNLRKSLAWDKAFFTNEGVLNPKELSLVNKTYKKANEVLLPSIEEESSVRSSLDSNSSAKNDYNFQVLEENLFAEHYESTDFKMFSAQSHSLTPSSAKLVVTEKKHTVSKVAKTPAQRPLYSVKESNPLRKELQKTSQQNDLSSKTALTANNKRRKFLHGKDEPVNRGRPSPNSVTSAPPSSARHPTSTPHFELQKEELASGTDLKSNRVLNELSYKNSESIVASHNPFQQSIPLTDPAIARDSAYLQHEKPDPVTEAISARATKPSGLRMPTPKMGFFDVDKVLHKNSGSARSLPPNMPKGPSAAHQASRLKPPGIPLNNTYSSYKGAGPSSVPSATHLRPESALLTSATPLRAPYPIYKGAAPTLRPESGLTSTTSVPANPRPQLKPNIEYSSLAALARDKFGYSRSREATYNKHVASYGGHNDNKLKSSFSSVPLTMEQKNNVQDISQGASGELHTDANCKETSGVETETLTHGNGAKVSEESMLQVAPQESSSNVNFLPVNSSVQKSADPFSEEWISALENVGEEWLQMKRGPVQHSPPDKVVPQPGPWSPVRRHSQQIGPFDCTKYTNIPGSDGANQDD